MLETFSLELYFNFKVLGSGFNFKVLGFGYLLIIPWHLLIDFYNNILLYEQLQQTQALFAIVTTTDGLYQKEGPCCTLS